MKVPRSPGWVEHVIWWQVYPLGFVGAPIRRDDVDRFDAWHRLPALEPWLDHVIELGLNGLQLGPVFASSTHGYDTVDYFRVDRRLGDEADLQQVIDSAHRRGVRVLLDGVFNHVGREHPLFQQLIADGPEAESADMFVVNWTGWKPGAEPNAAVFEGHQGLVVLNHSSPRVCELVTDVMRYWLDRGADGWRLDAAYAMAPSFWAAVLPQVRLTHPDAWFTGEVIHGDKTAFVEQSCVDSVTQYELWQAIWHSMVDGNLFELAHAIDRHAELLATFVPSTFIGNHDVTRIASAIEDLRHLPHAIAVLFTLAGTPSVYAGDEFAYRAIKEQRIGGDDAVRPRFPKAPPSNLAEETQRILDLTHHLISVRRENPWLHSAVPDVLHRSNDSIAFRSASASGAIVTVLNIGAMEVVLPIVGATHVIAGEGRIDGMHIRLAPHGWAVLK